MIYAFIPAAILILTLGFTVHVAMNNPEKYSGYKIKVNGEEVVSGYKAWLFQTGCWAAVAIPLGYIFGTILGTLI